MQKTTKTEECPKNNVDEREREKSGDSNIDQKEGEVGGEDEAPPESDGAANSGWLYAASKSLSLHLMQTLPFSKLIIVLLQMKLNHQPSYPIKYPVYFPDQTDNKEPPVSTSSAVSSTESASSSSSSYSAPITVTAPITTTYIQYAIDPKTNSQVCVV